MDCAKRFQTTDRVVGRGGCSLVGLIGGRSRNGTARKPMSQNQG